MHRRGVYIQANAEYRHRYINRELSWLSFNSRVLEQAARLDIPLFERVRFLSISASNLDEFYRIRLAGIKAQIEADATSRSIDGRTPIEQLRLIMPAVEALLQRQDTIWREIKGALKHEQISFPKIKELHAHERHWLTQYFHQKIYPLLTPITVDATRPCPFIANGSIAIVASLKSTEFETKEANALVLMPSGLGRFVLLLPSLNPAFKQYIALEDVIQAYLPVLFPSWEVKKSSAIRILRDGDLALDENAEDLYLTFENALKKRDRQAIVNVSHDHNLPKKIEQFIIKNLEVDPIDITLHYHLPVALEDVKEIIDSNRKDLLFPTMEPQIPGKLARYKGDMFAALKEQEWLFHHPYESFDIIVNFIKMAAEDADVVAIRHTLYRTSTHSPIVDALVQAAENNKNVTVMIELKARFDEANNLQIAKRLEEAGAQVVFGFEDLKTHAKICHVLRREGDELKHYTHIGTGNYHPITAKCYTDLSYLTSDAAIGEDAIKIFNFITSQSKPKDLHKLLYAPLLIFPSILAQIDAEIAHAKAGRPAYIWAKMNSLLEKDVIDKLYEASQVGVQIDLNIRGICSLHAGVKGLSEHIRVYSIIGRFLEHSRIFIFGNGHAVDVEGDSSMHHNMWISSADWMRRNLHRRIELMTPITAAKHKTYLLQCVYDAYQRDDVLKWYQQPNTEYIPAVNKTQSNCHTLFMLQAAERAARVYPFIQQQEQPQE